MLDYGMPQEEFDELVKNMKRMSELRVQNHLSGPTSDKAYVLRTALLPASFAAHF